MQSARPVVATLVIVALLLVSGCSAPSTVHAEDDDLGTVDVYADDSDTLLQALIHEYAHVLSLNVDQVPEASGSCETLELSEGCALPTSFIDDFQVEFWVAYGEDAPGPDNDDADVAYAFYETHEEDFVSDYAATNVTEDFAESFAAFVLEAEPDSDSPLAQKLDFFWNVPEFVEIRAHISEEFGLE